MTNIGIHTNLTDIEILTDRELMVAHVEGQNVIGDAFANNYVATPMAVLDANRFIVHLDELPNLARAADEAGISFEVVDKTPGARTA